MNAKERYLATLDGKVPDFLPRIPILMQYAAEYIGSNYAAFASDYRVLTEANLTCAGHFGMDQLNTMSDPYRETQGFGAEIIYEENTVPYCRKHPLEDSTDLDALPHPDPLEAMRMRDRIEAVRLYHKQAGGEYSIMGWVEGPGAEAADLRKLDNFFCDLMEEPGFCSELMSRCVDTALEFAKHQVLAGADTIGIGDAMASQVSPEIYEELILPQELRLVRGIREMGARARMHICGNITHLLPGLASLDLDVIDVDHMVDLGVVRQTLGPRVAIGANLNPVTDVLHSTPGEIRRKVLDCYARAGNPFLVNAGCEIPSGTPEKNLLALCTPVMFRAT
jgi:MtaA/CmuA family methyltransferase